MNRNDIVKKEVTTLLFVCICLFCGCARDSKLAKFSSTQVFAPIRVLQQDSNNAYDKNVSNKDHERTKRTNSLWADGSTSFAGDYNAWKVGDMLKVVVQIKDNAVLDNSTDIKRNGSVGLGLGTFFGEKYKFVDANADAARNIISGSINNSHKASGNVARRENITTEVTVLVVQKLQNGCLVVDGCQEIKINEEMRTVKIAGIVNPIDIRADRSVLSGNLGEARILYGGRGGIANATEVPVIHNIVNVISPF